MAILDQSSYKAVREALDLNLDEDTLPDDTIASEVFQGAAERELLRRYPAADPNHEGVILAAILLTAANIAPSMPRILQSSTVTAISLRVDQPRWDQIAAHLRARATEELTAATAPSTRPPLAVFTLAPGYRGRIR